MPTFHIVWLLRNLSLGGKLCLSDDKNILRLYKGLCKNKKSKNPGLPLKWVGGWVQASLEIVLLLKIIPKYL